MKRHLFFFFIIFAGGLTFGFIDSIIPIINDIWSAITLGCMVGGMIGIFSDKLYDLFFGD